MDSEHDAQDHDALTRGLRLVAIALASAMATATVVIAVGGAMIDLTAPAPALSVAPSAPLPSDARLVQTLG